MTNPKTLAAYETGVDRYLAALQPILAPPFAEFRERFLGRLRPGAQVLEIGSGPGIDADWFEARGVAVRRTDATAAFVRRLRDRGHQADLLNVLTDDIGGGYDGLWASAVLLHLSRPELAGALPRLRAALRPGGSFAFTVKEGDGEGWVPGKLAEARYFVYWRAEPLRALLLDAGWQVDELSAAAGRSDDWLLVRCRA